MKNFALFVWLAVSATAAVLKSPSAVEREWDQTIDQALNSTLPQTLLEHSLLANNDKKTPEAPVILMRPDASRHPRRNDQSPAQPKLTPPGDLPKGTKPWPYQDGHFYVIPLHSGTPELV